MALYIRLLSVKDLDQSDAVESAAFSAETAASREKIEYRLTVCPEVCAGLFVREGQAIPSQLQGDIAFTSEPSSSPNDKLIAHVLSTRSNTKLIKDEDMECSETWRTDAQPQPGIGNVAGGRTIALHALAVDPAHQKSGFGKTLMKSYIEYMRKEGEADRISILTYDRLVSYYEKLEFTHYGKSGSEYAGIEWHDLAYEYNS